MFFVIKNQKKIYILTRVLPKVTDFYVKNVRPGSAGRYMGRPICQMGQEGTLGITYIYISYKERRV